MSCRVKRQFVDGPFGQLHARSDNPADATEPAVVCLHMSPKSSRLFAEAKPELAAGRLVVAPDYPGHGEPDPPPGRAMPVMLPIHFFD